MTFMKRKSDVPSILAGSIMAGYAISLVFIVLFWLGMINWNTWGIVAPALFGSLLGIILGIILLYGD